MVLHDHCHSGAALVEDVTKVHQRRSESDCIHSKHSQERELNWENLVGSNNLDGDSHGEFFVLIFGRDIFILLYQILLAVREYCAVGAELHPNLECAIPLNESECGVELNVWLETLGEEELKLHGLSAAVMKNYLLPIELLVNHDIEVVFLLRDIDGHVHAVSEDL